MAADSPREYYKLWIIQDKADYLKCYPEETRYILGTAMNMQTGEMHQEMFQGNDDSGLMGRFITSRTYVNEWQCMFTEIPFIN